MKKQKTTIVNFVRKITILVAFSSVLLSGMMAPGKAFAQTDEGKSGTVTTNGISYYYEIHGQGEPLLLLHGGLGSGEMFNPILPKLAASHQVIVIDLHGHGRTALGDQKISITGMGGDMGAILSELGYDRVDVLGYSMGGGVGLQLAVQHPEMVNKIVLVGVVFSRDGYFPGILKQQSMVNAEAAAMMKGTPMYKTYKALAPHPEEFPTLLDQIGGLMAKPFDYSQDVKKLEMPVLLVYGDGSMIKPEHMVEFFHLLGGGLRDAGWTGKYMPQNHLAILPNLTHYNIFLSPEMVETALTFIENTSKPKAWKGAENK